MWTTLLDSSQKAQRDPPVSQLSPPLCLASDGLTPSLSFLQKKSREPILKLRMPCLTKRFQIAPIFWTKMNSSNTVQILDHGFELGYLVISTERLNCAVLLAHISHFGFVVSLRFIFLQLYPSVGGVVQFL